MSYTWTKDSKGYYINIVSEGSSSDPLTFNKIAEHFASSPISESPVRMPQTYGTGVTDYELTENNSSEWQVSGNLTTPADEATDKVVGSYSIKTTKNADESVVATVFAFQSYSSYWTQVVTNANHGLSVGDYVYISGTTNYNGVFRIKYVPASNKFTIGAPYVGNDATGNVYTPSYLEWYAPSGYTDTYSNSVYFNASIAQKIKFQIKTTDANIKLVGVQYGSYYSSSLPDYYGMTLFSGENSNQYWTITSGSWNTIDIDIRSQGRQTDNYYREWTHRISSIKFFFIGGTTGDILIDDLRFECPDPNPEAIDESITKIHTGITFDNCYLDDNSFTLLVDFTNSELYGGLYFKNGTIKLGRNAYSESTAKGGGQIVLMPFGEKSSVALYFSNNSGNDWYIDNIDFKLIYPTCMEWQLNGNIIKDSTTFYGNNIYFEAYSGNIYLNYCNFTNMGALRLRGSSASSMIYIKDMRRWGGGYAMYDPVNMQYVDVDGYQVALSGRYTYVAIFWISGGTVKGLDMKSSSGYTQNVVVCRNWRRTTDGVTLTFTDSDLSGLENDDDLLQFYQSSTTPASHIYYVRFYHKYTVNVTIVDEDGNPIDGATITVKDNTGATQFTDTTDANGQITGNQITKVYISIDYHGELYASDGTSLLTVNYYPNNHPTYGYFRTYLDGGADDALAENYCTHTIYTQFTITVSKSGYETYVWKGSIDNKLSKVIALKKAKAIIIDTDSNAYFNLDKVNLKSGKGTITKI